LTYDEVTGTGVGRIPFEQVDVARAAAYAAEDADLTLRIHHALYAKLEAAEKLLYVYRSIELPAREVLFRMERDGVLIDAAQLEAMSHELGQKMLELESKAHEEAGQPFNLGSPKQIAEIFFEKKGMPVIKKTPSGAPSTDEDVLEKLALDHPLAKILLDYREISKLKSTYTDKLPKMVNPRTGRVHTNYGQATAVTGRLASNDPNLQNIPVRTPEGNVLKVGVVRGEAPGDRGRLPVIGVHATAVTGRLASNDPNLQNIPVRTPEGRRIREAFVAARGHAIVSADYSQVELRIMAHISGDENLLRAFEAGEDIHRATAAEVFGRSLRDVTPEERRYA